MTELRKARLTGMRVTVPVEALKGRLSGLPAGVVEAVVKLVALATALNDDASGLKRSWRGRELGVSEALVAAVARPPDRADRRSEMIFVSARHRATRRASR